MRGGGQQILIGLRPSRAVIALIAINIGVVVVAGVASNYFHSDWLTQHLGLRPRAVVPGLELWQPFTYFWLHSLSDPGHLLWNLITLWLFSGPLEREWGSRRFVWTYVVCGLGAGLVVLGAGLLWQPDTVTVGASGAILGLVAAFGVLFPTLPVYVFGFFPLKGRTLAIIFAVLSIGAPLLQRHSNVSVAAHAGGLALGALIATGFWNPSRIARRVRLARARRHLAAVDGGKGFGGGRDKADGSRRFLN